MLDGGWAVAWVSTPRPSWLDPLWGQGGRFTSKPWRYSLSLLAAFMIWQTQSSLLAGGHRVTTKELVAVTPWLASRSATLFPLRLTWLKEHSRVLSRRAANLSTRNSNLQFLVIRATWCPRCSFLAIITMIWESPSIIEGLRLRWSIRRRLWIIPSILAALLESQPMLPQKT